MDKLKITAWGLILITNFLFPDLKGQDTHHWETIVFSFNSWHYKPGAADIPPEWKDPGYDLSNWQKGRGGIGYGDGDDETIIDETLSLFMRLDFDIVDSTIITMGILNADYDDGFVAYLNGVEIARSNIGIPGITPAWDETTPENHEAQMYQGGVPESFQLSAGMLDTLLVNGANTLAIQVHNRGINSSDLSSNFFFSVGISVPGLQYFYPPEWFYTPFESSNLPLMMIETNGQTISKGERIIAEMGLMDYSMQGKRNSLSDTFHIYNGRISIEHRGSSSLMFPKK
ncbi:MAG: hypothetical protein ACP5E3_07575, partial [Bacteroidales bacterium]